MLACSPPHTLEITKRELSAHTAFQPLCRAHYSKPTLLVGHRICQPSYLSRTLLSLSQPQIGSDASPPLPPYRGTSPIRKRPPSRTPHRTLGINRPTVGSQGGAFSHKRGTPVPSRQGTSSGRFLHASRTARNNLILQVSSPVFRSQTHTRPTLSCSQPRTR